jgi:hypothetical protein
MSVWLPRACSVMREEPGLLRYFSFAGSMSNCIGQGIRGIYFSFYYLTQVAPYPGKQYPPDPQKGSFWNWRSRLRNNKRLPKKSFEKLMLGRELWTRSEPFA